MDHDEHAVRGPEERRSPEPPMDGHDFDGTQWADAAAERAPPIPDAFAQLHRAAIKASKHGEPPEEVLAKVKFIPWKDIPGEDRDRDEEVVTSKSVGDLLVTGPALAHLVRTVRGIFARWPAVRERLDPAELLGMVGHDFMTYRRKLLRRRFEVACQQADPLFEIARQLLGSVSRGHLLNIAVRSKTVGETELPDDDSIAAEPSTAPSERWHQALRMAVAKTAYADGFGPHSARALAVFDAWLADWTIQDTAKAYQVPRHFVTDMRNERIVTERIKRHRTIWIEFIAEARRELDLETIATGTADLCSH